MFNVRVRIYKSETDEIPSLDDVYKFPGDSEEDVTSLVENLVLPIVKSFSESSTYKISDITPVA